MHRFSSGMVITWLLVALCGTAIAAEQPSPSNLPPAVEQSVVKVFATVRYPDTYRPWTKQAPTEVTGSGVVIDKNRILTNAHVVAYASQVQVQAHQSGDKVFARVEAVAPGIDLAVLSVDDPSFFASRPPIPRSNALPSSEEAVLVYGYPVGGNSLSITKGIVSRIDFVPYNNFACGLRIQIDAAINSGNSGGPALAGGKMIGVAFSVLNNTQGIGYIIPNEEVELFLADVADGRYDGKPGIYDEFQKMQNPQLRMFLKVPPTISGTIVYAPFRDGPDYPLRKWDVITHIGELPIDDEGMINVGPLLRVRFEYMAQKIAKGGKVPLTVFREGNSIRVDLPVSNDRPMLIPDLNGQYPRYFICGPIVFSSATTQFINGIDRPGVDAMTFSGNPLVTRRAEQPSFDGEEIVVISSPFFPSRLTKGYLVPVAWTVKSINGIAVKNLAHAVEILREATGDNLVLDFNSHFMETLVFPRRETLEATDEILADNGIRAQASPDLLAVWNAKPKPLATQ